MKTGLLFPVAPFLSAKAKMAIANKVDPYNVMAQSTGEFRCPKKGEWYLSGAIVEAYDAKNDLTTPYNIAELVTVENTFRVIRKLTTQ